ncbi:MAG: 3'-5' exonuclease [Oscillospiraceae bacterium]|jgi:DNA polymerase-3 subunit epsilon|nr:3'-5' exonuclease [Oscillospiraceae bacterium]
MIVFLDTETTGLCPGQICQLAMVKVNNDKLTAYNQFFKVEYVDYRAEQVHGFSVDRLRFLSKGKKFEDCIGDISEFLKGADIISGYNVPFDLRFLTTELERCRKFLPDTKIVDVMRAKGVKGKLTAMIESYNIKEETERIVEELFGELSGAHDARFDTVATMILSDKVGAIKEGVLC